MHKKTKILAWLVVFLLVTNLSTIFSVWYYSKGEQENSKTEVAIEIPGDRRTQFFRNKLGLMDDQMDDFREANRAFNRSARQITMELDLLRERLVQEMTSDEPNKMKITTIAKQIGGQHEELKLVTSSFYLEMASLCDAQQKEK